MPHTQAIVRTLLTWFRPHARDLPWRRTTDPYAIWISEVMLQQTQVKTVVPYWERWMRMLPAVRDLAAARPQQVLKLWEGLGYYSRARNLHRAARLIMRRRHGRFPTEFSEVLALPGVGPYTAGALCSIAFNQPRPVLDGNVARVLTRALGIDGNPRAETTRRQLWALAATLVEHAARSPRRGRNCADFNQALMELGATVCVPHDPACPVCPLRRSCVARRQGRVAELPNLPRPRPPTRRRFAAWVVEDRGRLFVRQRPAGGVNAGLWEFPNLELQADSHRPEVIAKRLLGVALTGELFCRLRHSITRYRITLDAFRARLPAGAEIRAAGRWLSLAAMNRLPFTRAHGKILDRLETRLPAETRSRTASACGAGRDCSRRL